MSFGMHAARKAGKNYELVADARWVFVDTQLLQELIDLAEEESDLDGEAVFTFDWFDRALYAEISQTPTAKDCRKPEEMLKILRLLKQRIDANPEKYKDYAFHVSMIALCEDAAKKGYLVHTTLT
ncbi:MAG TPA: hypothetical protein VK738_03590 [Terriglobales bacterium]|jgi:hypothetical protein|nr:hypothetical protein [Terriglobales bacterium]